MFVYFGTYIFILISGLFSAWGDEKYKRSYSKNYLFIFFIIIALISSLRKNTVGTDTLMYETIFYRIGNNFPSMNYLNKFPGYYFYNKILFMINSSSHFIIIVNSILIALLITYAISKLSINIYLTSILYFSQYFFFSSMNISRQYIAIGFLLLSFIFALKNKKIKMILAFLLAISFHQMAFIGFIFWFIPYINWNNKKYTILATVTIILLFFQNYFINLIVKILPQYASYLTVSDELNLSSQGSGNRIYMTIFVLFFIFLGLIVTKYNLDNTDDLFRSLLAINIISIVIDLVFSNNIMISRFSLYFSIFQIFYLPFSIHYFCKLFKNKFIIKYMLTIFVVIITTITMTLQLSKNQANVLPYDTILTK